MTSHQRGLPLLARSHQGGPGDTLGTPTPARLRGPAGLKGHTALKLWFQCRQVTASGSYPTHSVHPQKDGDPEEATPRSQKRKTDPGGDECENRASCQAPQLSGHANTASRLPSDQLSSEGCAQRNAEAARRRRGKTLKFTVALPFRYLVSSHHLPAAGLL